MAMHPHPARRSPATRITVIFLLLLLALTALVVVRLYTGDLPGAAKFRWPSGIILETHAMLIVAAIITGAALAGSGVALQALLRNPLAEPFILGLSSGAALGVMVQRYILEWLRNAPAGGEAGDTSAAMQWLAGAHYEAALLGAAATMAIVYIAGRRGGLVDPLMLLLTGVVVSMINGSLILLIRFLMPLERWQDISFWMAGQLSEAHSWPTVALIGGLTVVGGVLLWCLGRAMDAASFSDAEAASLGVNLARLRLLLFLTAAALAGGAVVLAGPLAFIGLVAPHLARLMLGPAHRNLILAAAIIGAGLVVAADLAVRLLSQGRGILPIGIFTVALGGPIFILMLRARLGRTSM